MTLFNRRVAGIAALVLLASGLAFGLAACGDNEPEQRKAFMAFLQQMNDRPGVHVMKPTAEDEKAFGDYTKHYDVILGFNRDMGELSKQFEQQMTKITGGVNRNIEQMAAHRDDLVAVGTLIEQWQPSIEKRFAQADAERAALKQPDDLKAVYDKTFARVITAPVRAIQKSNQALAEGAKVSLQLADYINSHRDKLTVNGSQVLAKDNKTLAEVGALLKAHQEAGKRFQDVQRDGQKLLQGG